MIEESALVVETAEGKALVSTMRNGACGSCQAQSGCKALGGGREARVWVEDPIGVKNGDSVVVAISETAFVKAGVAVYLVPVAALLAGAIIGNKLGPALGLNADLAAFILGTAALGMALFVARIWGNRNAKGPIIVRKEVVQDG
ncbi:MAG: Fis family transcriptional regulator [Deltaproteobacteria bacterium]|nr:MAG: Fis family transcriptional regulator [Deltaproteobacteria bacterium]